MGTANINCLIVPTGIGASIGGYAGDANPVAKLLSNVSDYLITHPNVVNGASMTKIPENVLVVEGYLLDQFFLNKIALRPKVKHKIGVVVDCDVSEEEKVILQNCLNAAKYFYGLDCEDNDGETNLNFTQEPVACEIFLEGKNIDNKITNEQALLDACSQAVSRGATALALLAKITDPPESEASKDYVNGEGYDPIGLIEAKISHLVSKEFMIPSAHAPILAPSLYQELPRSLMEGEGSVHPRVAAEYLGLSFLPSVLQCLNHSAGIVILDEASNSGRNSLKLRDSDIVISDLANLVIPYDSCNGVPMHEAHKHGIKLLSIKQNTTNLNETAESLGLKHQILDNYLEAAGYCAANRKDNNFVHPGLFLEFSALKYKAECV